MKRTTVLLSLTFALVTIACNKEDAIEPSANFTTNIQNNTLLRGQQFTVYLHDVRGEFIVYFRGHQESTTYSPTDPRRVAVSVAADADSVVVAGYPVAGQFTFTVVASSSGNWAKDYLQDVESITIDVINPTK